MKVITPNRNDIDYDLIGQRTSPELISMIKRDIQQILNSQDLAREIERFLFKESENYVIVAFFTGYVVYLYRYTKSTKTEIRKLISMSDYWIIEELLGADNDEIKIY